MVILRIFVAVFLFFRVAMGAEESSVRLSSLLGPQAWGKIVKGHEKRLDIPDPWLGDSVFGVEFKPDDEGLAISNRLRAEILGLLDGAKDVSTEQKEPWGPKRVTYVLLNQKGRAVYCLCVNEEKDWMQLSQIIQLKPGEARFGFGDEMFNYFEIESKVPFLFLEEVK